MQKFKRGEKVRVWSLQSWSKGGFLNGEPAVVIQDQIGDSVLLAVVRNFEGVYKLDRCYEVYGRQCEMFSEVGTDTYKSAQRELNDFIAELNK